MTVSSSRLILFCSLEMFLFTVLVWERF